MVKGTGPDGRARLHELMAADGPKPSVFAHYWARIALDCCDELGLHPSGLDLTGEGGVRIQLPGDGWRAELDCEADAGICLEIWSRGARRLEDVPSTAEDLWLALKRLREQQTGGRG
ncbi:MAG: hypothetical protein GMKNLPBB_00699 [Myxococcota bacterium]|nr:hypothetical protein [Myxococcota bacterium]